VVSAARDCDHESTTTPSIHKGYRCLVCIQTRDGGGGGIEEDDDDGEVGSDSITNVQGGEESVLQAWRRLWTLQGGSSSSSSSSGSTAPASATTSSPHRRPTVVRHFMRVSDRAPKEFALAIPIATEPNENNNDERQDRWLECLLHITNVSPPIPLVPSFPTFDRSGGNDDHCEDTPTATTPTTTAPTQGATSHSTLADALWPGGGIPPNVKAVAEVEVSLITGRTHQIRGQLSQLGFPLVGDELYGGAVASTTPSWSSLGGEHLGSMTGYDDQSLGAPQLPQQPRQPRPQQRALALECCQLSFVDAVYETSWNRKRRREIVRGRPNREGRRVEARLEAAWWTPLLQEYGSHQNDASAMIDLDADVGAGVPPASDGVFGGDGNSTAANRTDLRRTGVLPPFVQLSPGRNKYVLAKMRDPVTSRALWFVKSAAPGECGGDYHANVAHDLVEQIRSVSGFEDVQIEVKGGGRIDYLPSSSSSVSKAHVYGFSYRYGKGDHARTVALIQAHFGSCDCNISVTYDDSESLY
jgi:Janus/Ocnus family (Ocnus)